MQNEDAVSLIKDAVEPGKLQRWADLGCGAGNFTIALAELLAPGSEIFAYDAKSQQLPILHHNVSINFQRLNFEKQALPFNNYDGIFMANSLHYIKHKTELLQKLAAPRYLIIEYESRTPNPWVPYPIGSANLAGLFETLGYQTQRLAEYPSRFGGKMYSLYASL